MSRTWSLTNARVVTPDAVVPDATLVVVDGRIADVTTGAAPPDAVDVHGLLVLPGLVDAHCDGLEKEISPRRTATFPVDFAVGSFEGRVRAAGVTTAVHGVGYQHKPRIGRSLDGARAIVEAIDERRGQPSVGVDHRILFRFEARDEHGVAAFIAEGHHLDTGANVRPLVSFEDHTPGQGQFRDIAAYEAAIDPTMVPAGMTTRAYVESVMAEAHAAAVIADKNRALLAPLGLKGDVTLLAHDLETVDEVDLAHAHGSSVAEFPLTVEAASRASQLGMRIVMGAPNALRGSSHSGNVSARDLVASGLCDVLAADYLPTSLLAAVFELVTAGACSLPQGVRLVTMNPAAMIGAPDRGHLSVGAVADVVVVDDRHRWPTVVSVSRSADATGWTAVAGSSR